MIFLRFYFPPLSYALLKPSFLLLYYGKMNLVYCLVAGFLNYSVNHCLLSLSLSWYLFFKISVSAGDLVGNKGMFVGGLIKKQEKRRGGFCEAQSGVACPCATVLLCHSARCFVTSDLVAEPALQLWG